MHTFGDERHLSSLRVMLTLQTAPLVSALFITVAMKCESCYLSAIRASAFFPLRHCLARHVSAGGGGSLSSPSIVVIVKTSAEALGPHGDEEKKKKKKSYSWCLFSRSKNPWG